MSEQTACCIICGQADSEGIRVCGHTICRQCEQSIVSIDVEDPDYLQIVSKLKQLWQAAY
ncbi:MAG: sigma factor G inhibitor Gin [Bacillota bacterium]|jgi:hypothetical protein